MYPRIIVAATLVALLGCGLGNLAGASKGERAGEPAKPVEKNERVAKLFKSMHDSKYSEASFPKLGWEDVPGLLALADSTKLLTSFPRNPLSSQLEKECTEGMVALWLIDGIRQGGKYPSLNALCFKAGKQPGNWQKASEENHKDVAKAYRDWWERVRQADKNRSPKPGEKARASDPLQGTNLHWH